MRGSKLTHGRLRVKELIIDGRQAVLRVAEVVDGVLLADGPRDRSLCVQNPHDDRVVVLRHRRQAVGAKLVAHRPRTTAQDLVRELLELSEREHRQLLVLEEDAVRSQHG